MLPIHNNGITDRVAAAFGFKLDKRLNFKRLPRAGARELRAPARANQPFHLYIGGDSVFSLLSHSHALTYPFFRGGCSSATVVQIKSRDEGMMILYYTMLYTRRRRFCGGGEGCPRRAATSTPPPSQWDVCCGFLLGMMLN